MAEREYTSKGQGNYNTVAGSIGIASALGLMSNGCGNGLNLFGNNRNGCDQYVTRYDAQKEDEICRLRSDKAILESTIFTDNKLNDFRNYVDAKFEKQATINTEQAVYNATNSATISCVSGQVISLQDTLKHLTKTVIPNSSVCPGFGNVKVVPVDELCTVAVKNVKGRKEE